MGPMKRTHNTSRDAAYILTALTEATAKRAVGDRVQYGRDVTTITELHEDGAVTLANGKTVHASHLRSAP